MTVNQLLFVLANVWWMVGMFVDTPLKAGFCAAMAFVCFIWIAVK